MQLGSRRRRVLFMNNREFLMLSKPFEEKRDRTKIISNKWWVSEKLDGVRCFWDGGVSYGMEATSVPWANTTKDGRLREVVRCTGLWTRYGKVIHAPNSFIQELFKVQGEVFGRPVCLDGELYIDRDRFQDIISVVKNVEEMKESSGRSWKDIKFIVFDKMRYCDVFDSGRINNPNFKKIIRWGDIEEWLLKRPGIIREDLGGSWREYHWIYSEDLTRIREYGSERIEQLLQREISSWSQIVEIYQEVCDMGGEGIMIRNPEGRWIPRRVGDLLKMKAQNDMEGTVVGYKWGKEGKGGKYLGMMGSMLVRLDNGIAFELSGFTDGERVIVPLDGVSLDVLEVGRRCQGEIVDNKLFGSAYFQLGQRVSFKYRELSRDGIPKEARYWRKREII